MSTRVVSIVTALVLATAALVSTGPAQAADPAPVPLGQPSITGTPRVGQTLTAHSAGWPVAGESTYAWTGTAGQSATDTYVPKADDLGHVITLTETFRSPGKEDATTTVTSAVIAEGIAPDSPGPGIWGTVEVGQTISVERAQWTVAGESTFAWTVGGAVVETGEDYAVETSDLGRSITVTETWTRPGYPATTRSFESAVVVRGRAPVATVRPRVAGSVRIGSTLRATRGTWPLAGASTLVWSVGGKKVGTGTSYEVRPADVGEKLIVVETLTAAGYLDGRSTVDLGFVPKEPVTMAVTVAKAKKGKKVAPRVTARSHRRAVPGRVTVTYAGKVRTAGLSNGTVTVKLPAKPRGRYWLTIAYTGPAMYGRAGRTLAVTVR